MNNPIPVSISVSDAVQPIYVPNTQNVSSTSGMVSFSNISVCGKENTGFTLTFSGYQNNGYFIFGDKCSINLGGCGIDQTIRRRFPCDTCENNSGLTSAQLIFIILAAVIVLLVCILLIVFLGLGGWFVAKKRKKSRMKALIIPDFSSQPFLTISDILKDKAIPRLDWRSIQITKPIGQGASGLVSKGVLTQSGKNIEIALKELIFGFQDIQPEIIQEFLVEIKYLR